MTLSHAINAIANPFLSKFRNYATNGTPGYITLMYTGSAETITYGNSEPVNQ